MHSSLPINYISNQGLQIEVWLQWHNQIIAIVNQSNNEFKEQKNILAKLAIFKIARLQDCNIQLIATLLHHPLLTRVVPQHSQTHLLYSAHCEG